MRIEAHKLSLEAFTQPEIFYFMTFNVHNVLRHSEINFVLFVLQVFKLKLIY